MSQSNTIINVFHLNSTIDKKGFIEDDSFSKFDINPMKIEIVANPIIMPANEMKAS